MKTIIVATDFSIPAHNAAIYAADMAQTVGATLHLLHVLQPPVNYGDFAVPYNFDEWQQDAEDAVDKLKGELHQHLNGGPKIHAEVRVGNYFSELDAVCKEHTPYAVVIGSTGRTAGERLLFGSNAVQTMKYLAWPVITVPIGTKFTSIHKVGLACDLENVVDTVPVKELDLLINDFHAELHILNIGRQEKFDSNPVFAAGHLEQVLAKAKPHFHFISHTDIDKGIIDFTEKNGIDLLIVIPKRHGLLDTLLHKSHTKQFVLHSHVPVMALQASHS